MGMIYAEVLNVCPCSSEVGVTYNDPLLYVFYAIKTVSIKWAVHISLAGGSRCRSSQFHREQDVQLGLHFSTCADNGMD
jgi:hypothetical protein